MDKRNADGGLNHEILQILFFLPQRERVLLHLKRKS